MKSAIPRVVVALRLEAIFAATGADGWKIALVPYRPTYVLENILTVEDRNILTLLEAKIWGDCRLGVYLSNRISESKNAMVGDGMDEKRNDE